MDKELLSFSEFCAALGIKDTLGKKLIREGRVLSVRIGDRRLIPTSAVRAYVDSLIAEAAGRELATVN